MFSRALIAGFVLGFAVAPAPAAYLNDQLNQAWAAFHNLPSFSFSIVNTGYRALGYRMIDFDAHPSGSSASYSQIWEKNADPRAWVEAHDLTAAQYHTRWSDLAAQGYRPSDFESYTVNGVQRYGGIWVKNTEGWGWSSQRDMTSAQYATYFDAQRAAGRRPIDIEVYQTAGGLRYAAIWYQNVGNLPWGQLRDMTRTTYQQYLNAYVAAGYRVIDFESYQSGATQLYAAIWARNPVGRAWTMRSDLSWLQFSNFSRLHKDEGYRLVDYEAYATASGVRYAGLWVENDTRFDYARKNTLTDLIEDYQARSNGLPAISVAIIRNGTMIYRRGFGQADINDGKIAHAETVYSAASVSKVIGGTLAAKLEDEDHLRDGTTIDLDLNRNTSFYIGVTRIPSFPYFIRMPAWHTHTVEQLTAHLACIGYYSDSNPAIPNQTVHYATQFAAVRSIWNYALRQGCTIGQNWNYSTAAFTFVGAVIEDATGRSLSRLIREELAVPYGLPSLRVQFETSTLPYNYDRASAYDDDTEESAYQNTSWKILGGGLELNAVDLATFGWKVLAGQIVSPAVRDNRLWAPVSGNCATRPDLCVNGLGWSIGGSVAQHGGSQHGTRTYILVYRNHGLVIAIMSNRDSGHASEGIGGLAAALGAAVLAP